MRCRRQLVQQGRRLLNLAWDTNGSHPLVYHPSVRLSNCSNYKMLSGAGSCQSSTTSGKWILHSSQAHSGMAGSVVMVAQYGFPAPSETPGGCFACPASQLSDLVLRCSLVLQQDHEGTVQQEPTVFPCFPSCARAKSASRAQLGDAASRNLRLGSGSVRAPSPARSGGGITPSSLRH